MSLANPETPKEHLIHFVTKVKSDDPYEFVVNGDENNAKAFVHRMRVELSRMRDKVREKGRVPKVFKVYLSDVQLVDSNPAKCKVTICRKKSPNDMTDELHEIFDSLDGGQILEC